MILALRLRLVILLSRNRYEFLMYLPQELSGGPRAEDLLASLRSGPPAPVQKSQDLVTGKGSGHHFSFTQT